MGDSSDYCYTNNSHVSFPADIKYIDSEEDEAVKKSTFSAGTKGIINGGLTSTHGDVHIQIEDLNTPVPICPDTDASCSDNNGLEENCVAEPKISSSEALGKEANGFDEAAEIEGSEEEVRTGSPTGSSEAWAEDNFSDEDSNHGLERNVSGSRRTQMLISHGSDIPYQQFHNYEDRYCDRSQNFATNGAASPHKYLYSGGGPGEYKQYEMKEFVGRGENTSLHNYSPPDKNKPRGTIDTYEASALCHRLSSYRKEIDEPVSFKLQTSSQNHSLGFDLRQPASVRAGQTDYKFGSPKLTSNTRSPLPSSSSPSISGSRNKLPYETSPPFNYPPSQSKIQDTAVSLISQQGIMKESPTGMPRGEAITYDENDCDASGNEVEVSKKKKKKKKRSGNKSGDIVEPEKKQGKNVPPCGATILDKSVTGPVQESRAQQYPPANDCGSSVMEAPHRSKAKQSGKKNKKTEVKSYSAKDIDGNRGCEDIEILLHFVEGKKPVSKNKVTAAPASSESKKKHKKQKFVTRTVANSAPFEVGKSTPLVMGRVVENAVISTEDAVSNDHAEKPCVDFSTVSTSGSGMISIDAFDGNSLVSPKVDGSGDQSTILEDTPEPTSSIPNESKCAIDEVKQVEASTPSDPVTEPLTKKEANDIEVKTSKPYVTESSPPSVADLDFTNFEGLVDHYTEQPFEKYVGRKKKQRQQQPTQQFRQGYATNSSGHPRGRWLATNQPNNVHVNSSNRAFGNGVSYSSQSPHSQAGATNNKLPANQPVGRYPTVSTPQSFAAKASSSSRTSQQMSNDPQRKSTGSTASSVTSPPLREEFPPLRPSADAQTLKKEISPSTSITTSTSSPALSKNSGNVFSSASGTAPCGSPSSELRTADRHDVCIAATAAAAAARKGSKYFDHVNILKIKQFFEMLYPKQNETCYFYSETAKRYHFLKVSAKDL